MRKLTKSAGRGSVRRGLIGLSVAAAAVVLVGCSEVDTELVFDSDLAGSRTMTVYLSDSDLADNVPVPATDLDAIAESNLPNSLSYTPFAAAEGGVQSEFTLNFDSVEDYEAKVQSLLDLGGVETEAQIDVWVLDSPFSEGFLVEENFTSAELLQWLIDPLLDAGVIDESETGDVFSLNENWVTVDGTRVESYSSEIYVDELIQTGMYNVEMRTEMVDDGKWIRTVNFYMDDYSYEKVSSKVDDYFSKQIPSGATLEEKTGEYGDQMWTVTLPALTPEELVKATDELLYTDDTEFSFEREEGARFFGEQYVLHDTADCAQICDTADVSIYDELIAAEGWQVWADNHEGEELTVQTDGAQVLFGKYFPIDSVDVDLSIGMTGKLNLDIAYRFTDADALEQSDMIVETVSGPSQLDVEEDEADGETTYTVKISAADPEELDLLLGEYLPGSDFAYGDSGGFFSRDFSGFLSIALSDQFGDVPVENGLTFDVSVPLFSSVEADDTEFGRTSDWPVERTSFYEADIVFSGSGVTLAGLITLAVVIIILIAGAVLLFIYRDRIRAASAKRSEARVLTGPGIAVAVVVDGWIPDFPAYANEDAGLYVREGEVVDVEEGPGGTDVFEAAIYQEGGTQNLVVEETFTADGPGDQTVVQTGAAETWTVSPQAPPPAAGEYLPDQPETLGEGELY